MNLIKHIFCPFPLTSETEQKTSFDHILLFSQQCNLLTSNPFLSDGSHANLAQCYNEGKQRAATWECSTVGCKIVVN